MREPREGATSTDLLPDGLGKRSLLPRVALRTLVTLVMPFLLLALERPSGTGRRSLSLVAWRRDDERWLVVGVGLPRLGQWLVDHPIMTPVVPAIAAGAFGTVDRPVDWPFVFGLAGVVGFAVAVSGIVVRRRVNREEFDSTAGPVSEPPSNVRTEPPA